MSLPFRNWRLGMLYLLSIAHAITVDLNDRDSIISVANTMVENVLTFYPATVPGPEPGLVDAPYFWWEAGGMFGQLIHYWHITGNASLNGLISDGILAQTGANNDFQPAAQASDLGNDDQLFWSFTAMDAAEFGFPNPPASQPSWLSLAQAVFNTVTILWDTTNCGGGLRWQKEFWVAGYDYKNVIANGGLLQLSARLYRFTGNQTYADWAEKEWQWLTSGPLLQLTDGPNPYYNAWDGVFTTNCSQAIEAVFTYNIGTLIMGAAYMYNATNGSSLWQTRLEALLPGSDLYFVQSAGTNDPPVVPSPGGQILSEVICETVTPQTCGIDKPSFKAFTLRWLAVTTQLAPFTAISIMPRLQASALAAATQCTGGTTGSFCGRRWYQTVWDGYDGLGEQLSALSVFQNNLIGSSAPPLTLLTGGTSPSNPSAGTADPHPNAGPAIYTRIITTADKAGAGIMTILGAGLISSVALWLIWPS